MVLLEKNHFSLEKHFQNSLIQSKNSKRMKLTNLLAISFLALFLVTFSACGGGEAQTAEETTEAETPPVEEAKTISLTPFSESTPYPDANITSMTFEDNQFTFGVEGENYELGAQTPDAPQKMCANSAKGQHIHLIIDNAPYAAKYEASFPYEISEGDHYLLAFLSRSYHESIKTDQAHVAKKITVAGKSISAEEDITDPMLFYSRPKGSYVGKADTDKVMLDFYLKNVTLGEEYKVKVEINDDAMFMVDTWQPYYIEGLPMGDNKVKLTLVDAEGNAVDTPLNPVERVFTLAADPAEGAQ